jgi:hypothetical protein
MADLPKIRKGQTDVGLRSRRALISTTARSGSSAVRGSTRPLTTNSTPRG